MVLATATRTGWEHRHARLQGVRLHYVEAGEGPLVVLLHGFPEFWYAWRHQIPALAAAGFHVIAPDLRGYNLSDKPPGIPSYRVDVVLEDVVGLIRHAGAERASVVGHDWGGVIAWHLAFEHPELVKRLVILNAPHPAAYHRELRTWEQMLRSWYILFFQVPGLPEQMLAAGDYDLIGRMLRREPVHAEAFTPADILRYKRALARPGALTAALNYYRALRDPAAHMPHDVPILDIPTLVLWGENDLHLSTHLTEGLQNWVRDVRVVRFPDVSHWIQNDAPERVNRLLTDFLYGLPVPQVQ